MLRAVSRLFAWVFRHRDITIDGELYLRRIYLTPRALPLFVFVHFIFRSDEGRWLHDHPWDFWSLLLFRGYRELSMRSDQPRVDAGEASDYEAGPVELVERRFGWLSWIRHTAEYRHRVIADKPVVTLCFVRPARQKWGFFPHNDDRWVYWRDWLGLSPEDQPDFPEDVIR